MEITINFSKIDFAVSFLKIFGRAAKRQNVESAFLTAKIGNLIENVVYPVGSVQ